jgi:hypothetical protein
MVLGELGEPRSGIGEFLVGGSHGFFSNVCRTTAAAAGSVSLDGATCVPPWPLWLPNFGGSGKPRGFSGIVPAGRLAIARQTRAVARFGCRYPDARVRRDASTAGRSANAKLSTRHAPSAIFRGEPARSQRFENRCFHVVYRARARSVTPTRSLGKLASRYGSSKDRHAPAEALLVVR